MEALKKNQSWKGRRGPVVLVIMDGVGYGKYKEGDAVADAKMYNLKAIKAKSPHTKLKAHGRAVGLPSDEDMGNSEVGHNAMGCGRVFNQGAALVTKSIETGALFEGRAWKEVIANLKEGKIAVNTPIGKGLLGKKVGDIAEIKVPSGLMSFEIINIAL